MGNLILIPRPLNDELGDLSFLEKQQLLRRAAKEGVYVDPFILTADHWDNRLIQERTNQLAKRAYAQVWALS